MEGSFFTAWKCTQDGAISYFAQDKVVYTDMIFIDNRFSASLLIGKEGDALVT
jgi:hypothetical protein